MPTKKPKKAKSLNDKIDQWDNAWKSNKNNYDDFVQFIQGNQWLDDEARVMESYKKIPLTFNKISPLANHMLGEQRQNTPTIECVPDESVPEQTAEIRQTLVHDITFHSNSKEVFQTGFQSAILGGYGAWYVDMEYENETTFNKRITINKVLVPNNCFWDVSSDDSTKTEGMFCGIKTRISRPKLRSLYGKDVEKNIPPSNMVDGSFLNDDDTVTLITFWERKYKPEKLYQLSNGRTVGDEEFKALERMLIDDNEMLIDNGEPVTIINQRQVPKYKIKKSLWAGEYELESEDFPSQTLPLVFVDQNSFINKSGSQICNSFFKHTKDAQRYINYLGTQSAYLVKIGRYDQFMGSKENVKSLDTQRMWRDPSNVQGMLIYNESASGAKPEHLKPPELSQSMVQQYERAERDIQTTTGLYQAFLGDQGKEISGVAVNARNKRTSFTTHVPFDNLNRCIAITSKIIDEMIPFVYDTHRTLMLNMKDKGVSAIEINKPMDEYGSNIQNDMTAGKYTIKLQPGPSWEGQKQEALDSMQMVIQAAPDLFKLFADLYAENLPLANNIELRNRLRTIVPPEIIEAGKTGQPVPPAPQQPDPMVMMKMQELKLKEQELVQKQQKLQIEAHMSAEELEMKWQQLEAEKEEAAAKLQEMELRYVAETGRTQSNEQIAHADNLVKILTHKHHKNKED